MTRVSMKLRIFVTKTPFLNYIEKKKFYIKVANNALNSVSK